MNRYYSEVLLSERDPSFAISQVISIVHFLNTKYKMNFGIDFPDFNKDDLGRRIRVFNTHLENIETFDKSPRLNELSSYQLVKISQQSKTLPSLTQEVLLFRNNKVEKRQPDYWVRSGYSKSEALELIQTLNIVSEISHKVELHSFSNNRIMHRYLSRIDSEVRHDNYFSSYGLGKISQPATVPVF